SSTPALDQLGLPAINKLKTSLQNVGFKSNENFLAWQWTSLYPLRRDFLIRFTQQPEKLLDETEAILKDFLIERGELLEQANAALQATPRNVAVSLDQLRSKRND
ncbi:MAG: hypothetical protein OEV15_09235, partial [Gallionella sp.]|nr:hypothetical protein [Gallionella sp.]